MLATTMTPRTIPPRTTVARAAAPMAATGSFTVTAGPVLVATDGTAQSEPAIAAASRLAGAGDDTLRLLTVVEDLTVIASPEAVVPAPDVGAARRADALRLARAQAERVAERGTSPRRRWHIEVRNGPVSPTIASVAEEMGARLIVVGLGRHDLVHRLFGSETALHLIREAHAPVLAVAGATGERPRRIVCAIDFSAASIRAAKVALELAAPDATVTLAHVIPWEAAGVVPDHTLDEYRAEIERRLARIGAILEGFTRARIERRVLSGPPARRILDVAREVGADLIATGTRGRGAVARLVLGQVAGTILRGATCSVLAVPHANSPRTA